LKVDDGPRALEYVSPVKKPKKRAPDVLFLFAWMLVFVACYAVVSVVAVGLGTLLSGI
jgi:hypothetical protein